MIAFQDEHLTLYQGHVMEELARMPDHSIQTVVTSPPYWLLRNYGLPPTIWGGRHDCQHSFLSPDSNVGQRCAWCGAWKGDYGLEPSLQLYLDHTVQIFREVHRVLKRDGTLWLNLGDVFASGKGTCVNPGGGGTSFGRIRKQKNIHPTDRRNVTELRADGLKPKDLVGIPWRVALALQADGWFLRRDVIWEKTNPMPESVQDRPTTAHEYLFLLSKSPRYYYDWRAIAEDVKPRNRPDHGRNSRMTVSRDPGHLFEKKNAKVPAGWDTKAGAHNKLKGRYSGEKVNGNSRDNANLSIVKPPNPFKNKRSVWRIASRAYKDAHFATFPVRLVTPCILAGSRPGDVVLDPFLGSGTVAEVSIMLGRRCAGIELKPDYVRMALTRVGQVQITLPAQGVHP